MAIITQAYVSQVGLVFRQLVMMNLKLILNFNWSHFFHHTTNIHQHDFAVFLILFPRKVFYNNWLVHWHSHIQLRSIVLFFSQDVKFNVLRPFVWLNHVKPTCCKVRDLNVLILCWMTRLNLLRGYVFKGDIIWRT